MNCHATTKEMGKKIPERFRIIPYSIRFKIHFEGGNQCMIHIILLREMAKHVCLKRPTLKVILIKVYHLSQKVDFVKTSRLYLFTHTHK